jgi:hypothetical protein
MQIIIQRLGRGLIRFGLVAAKTKPLSRKSLGNPWRLSYPEESTVAPNAIRRRQFFQKPGQEQQERISGNQLALFRLWLRWVPEGCLVVVTRDGKQPGTV